MKMNGMTHDAGSDEGAEKIIPIMIKSLFQLSIRFEKMNFFW